MKRSESGPRFNKLYKVGIPILAVLAAGGWAIKATLLSGSSGSTQRVSGLCSGVGLGQVIDKHPSGELPVDLDFKLPGNSTSGEVQIKWSNTGILDRQSIYAKTDPITISLNASTLAAGSNNELSATIYAYNNQTGEASVVSPSDCSLSIQVPPTN